MKHLRETYKVIPQYKLNHSSCDANNARKCNQTHRVFRPLNTIAVTPIFNTVLLTMIIISSAIVF